MVRILEQYGVEVKNKCRKEDELKKEVLKKEEEKGQTQSGTDNNGENPEGEKRNNPLEKVQSIIAKLKKGKEDDQQKGS